MCASSLFTNGALTSFLMAVILQLCFHDSLVQAAPPVVSNLPVTRYVGELENGERLLHIFTIADPNGDSYTCEITITVTAGGGTPAAQPEFKVVQNSDTGNHELWVTSSADFDIATYDITAFRAELICTDPGNSSSVPKYIDIEVIPNEVVTIDNVAGTTNDVTVNALATPKNQLIKTVSATSDLGHDIIFNMSVNPSMAPLAEFFVIDPSSGEIRTNREMKYLDSGTTTVFLTVTAHDNVDSIEVFEYLTVHMTNQNTIPATANLDTPKRETKLETLAAGTVLLTLTTVDPDTSQGHTYSFSCVPSQGDDTFVLDNNGNFEIAPGKSLDYESISFYNCSFFINDGIHTGGAFVYELTVADDNEAPTFSEVMLYATVSEGAKGSVTWTPGFTCTDVDSGDTTTYALAPFNNSDRFAIDSSGRMTFDTNYDVDNNAMPSSVVLTVYCIDSGGADGEKLTGSTQITITVEDVNDNEPVFSDSSYTFNINQFTTPGSVVGAITPTDADSGSNAAVTCSGVSGATYGPYFSVGQDCNVYLTQTIDFAYGTHTTYTAYGVDDGSPQLTGTTAIDIVYRETTTTTTTTTTAATTTAYNFFDHAENIAMLAMLLLMSLLLLGLLSWCLARLCCGCGTGGGGLCKCMAGGRNKMYPPRQVMPNSPPPQYEPPRVVEKFRVVRTVARPGFSPGGYPRLPISNGLPGTGLSNPGTQGFY